MEKLANFGKVLQFIVLFIERFASSISHRKWLKKINNNQRLGFFCLIELSWVGVSFFNARVPDAKYIGSHIAFFSQSFGC